MMQQLDWNRLDETQRRAALARPAPAEDLDLDSAVARIIAQVRHDGDNSIRALTRRFDQVSIGDLQVPAAELRAAVAALPSDLDEALRTAQETISRYHRHTVPAPFEVETAPGVQCARVIRPIRTVGLYIPAGTAPLPSTVLMLGVPAKLAGCEQLVLCSPPGAHGSVDPLVLAAADRVGIDTVFRVGGAQAIAAMAFGTETVPRCDKIFGPGNRWVTRAKQQVAQLPGGAAIDMPAGPSELMVIADETARADFIAADLLSQAEHGSDSQVLLITASRTLADQVGRQIEQQLERLPRAETARAALANGRMLIVDDLAQAVAVANRYAPEHLIVMTASPRQLLDDIRAAGSVFLGPWSPEALGDYCSGTNHVLPTDGWARALSGVGVDSFTTRISVQEASPQGLLGLASVAERMAAAEGLDAHRQAVAIRREALDA